MTDNDPISWRTIVYGTAVVGADGSKVGIVKEVLGSDAEDIFHGVRVALDSHDVAILASDISSLTASAVTTVLSAAEIHALPAYDETATFHLASVGWLRKHIGWQQDSKSDEEPG